jgi:hypothetical protein
MQWQRLLLGADHDDLCHRLPGWQLYLCIELPNWAKAVQRQLYRERAVLWRMQREHAQLLQRHLRWQEQWRDVHRNRLGLR